MAVVLHISCQKEDTSTNGTTPKQTGEDFLEEQMTLELAHKVTYGLSEPMLKLEAMPFTCIETTDGTRSEDLLRESPYQTLVHGL